MKRCARCYGDLHDLAVFCPNCAQAHEPDFDLLLTPERQLIDDRYRIYKRLGQGGLSTVFAATELQTGRIVVIKVSDPAQLVQRDLSYSIGPEEARNYWSEMLDRMRREAEILATIPHPNIVRFYGTGMINDDLRYVAMEYLDGETLRQEIDGKGAIPITETIDIALGVTSALSEVHSRGIIHRDINPQNIFVLPSDGSKQVKLIDFGIAKFPQPTGAPPFTHHSVMSGTVAYASPEQCQSRPLDHRTDIYSLGVVLYEMLTGQRPFTGRTPTEIALKHIQSEPLPLSTINPELPANVEKAILRALAKNPDARQQSVDELASEITAGSGQIFISLTPGEEDTRIRQIKGDPDIPIEESYDDQSDHYLRQIRRRRRATLVVAAALILSVCGGAVLLGRNLFHLRTAPQLNTIAGSPSPASTTATNIIQTPAGSDADSLELAAQLSQNSGQPSYTSTGTRTGLASQVTPEIKPSPAPNANPSHTSSTIPTSQPELPRAKPQTPPAPAPTISATRIPQPQAQPDLAQSPGRNPHQAPQQTSQSEENGRIANSQGQSDREPVRQREAENTEYRRPQVPTNRSNEAGASNRDAMQQPIGPQLIQWNGTVDRERLIKIEMPGVPGTIEIPRVYRDRVGIVEPPSGSNQWRYATLRVFGKGGVTILVRWWPTSG